MCSTPFGITEVGTKVSTVGSERLPLGAQRLSASQRSAHVWGSTRPAQPTLCSTPFGITEVGTLWTPIPGPW